MSENCLALLHMKFIPKCSGGTDGAKGGRSVDVDDILEFSPTSGKWTVVDNMMKARRRHAVSVIKSDNVEGFCIN